MGRTIINNVKGSTIIISDNQIVVDGKRVDNQPKQQKEKTKNVTFTKKFNAKKLDLQKISGHVKIKTHQENFVQLTLTGQQSEIDNVQHYVSNDILSLRSKKQKKNNNNVTIINGDFIQSNWNVTGDIILGNGKSVKVESDSNENSMNIELLIPSEVTLIHAKEISGTFETGDINAHLELSTAERGTYNIGAAKDVSILSTGHSKVIIKSVSSTLIANAQGHSSITVEEGLINSTLLNANGHAKVKINAIAESGTLSAMGHSSIEIKKIKKGTIPHCSRFAKIKIVE